MKYKTFEESYNEVPKLSKIFPTFKDHVCSNLKQFIFLLYKKMFDGEIPDDNRIYDIVVCLHKILVANQFCRFRTEEYLDIKGLNRNDIDINSKHYKIIGDIIDIDECWLETDELLEKKTKFNAMNVDKIDNPDNERELYDLQTPYKRIYDISIEFDDEESIAFAEWGHFLGTQYRRIIELLEKEKPMPWITKEEIQHIKKRRSTFFHDKAQKIKAVTQKEYGNDIPNRERMEKFCTFLMLHGKIYK